MALEIPLRTKNAIDKYVEEGQVPGGFVRSVLENKLNESLARADLGNLKAIKAITDYVYNHTPSQCWGSEEKVNAWIKSKNPSKEEAVVIEALVKASNDFRGETDIMAIIKEASDKELTDELLDEFIKVHANNQELDLTTRKVFQLLVRKESVHLCHNDETGEEVYAIVSDAKEMKDEPFWMGTFETEILARKFCERFELPCAAEVVEACTH